MPLTRYQIRNEYGLADPDLYRAADKDDPEALLEGVAMAGLVGVLRQLGDLAEFAAEIFHDLHEEVMATAARGHGLMARVQQLETEFPSIEKAFLSQTSHTSFFSNAGIDWHPNLHAEQNLIACGDLPRFVMDSYEECRGPPRLFLLDKFDVAGAGACLKRYTDPSFFKVASTSFEMEIIEHQREKKIRKVKKKGFRWRNAETPEVGPTSHAKLHQLFLEERIENGYNDPARLVKLKKKQLNGYGVDSKTGKSYMEKILDSPSPDHKMICETSMAPTSLQLVSDNLSESEFKILEISTVSPVMKSPGRESTCSSCIAQEVLKQTLDDELTDRIIVNMPEPTPDDEIEEIPNNLHDTVIVNENSGDVEGKPEKYVDGYHSDDLTSEVDTYVDALNTMDLDLDTDNENRLKKAGKNGTEPDTNGDHLEARARFLVTQSHGNSSGSDDGNTSFGKDRSSFSSSDSVSMVDNITSDGDGVAEASDLILETCIVDAADMPSNPPSVRTDSLENEAEEIGMPDNSHIDEEKSPTCGEASSNSCLSDSNSMQSHSDPGANSSVALIVRSGLGEGTFDHVNNDSETSKTVVDLDDFKGVVPSQTSDDACSMLTFESYLVNEWDVGDPNIASNDLERDDEKNSIDRFANEMLQSEYQNLKSSESFFIDSPSSSSTEKHLSVSTLPVVKSFSGAILPIESLPKSIDSDIKYNNLVSKADDSIMATELISEELSAIANCPQNHSLKEQQLSNVTDGVPHPVADREELGLFYSEEKLNSEEVLRTADDGEFGVIDPEVHVVGPNATLDEAHCLSESGHEVHANPGDSDYKTFSTSVAAHSELLSSGDSGLEDHMNFVDVAAETIPEENVTFAAIFGSASVLELPSKGPDDSCHENHLNLDSVPNETVLPDSIVAVAGVSKTNDNDVDNVNEVTCASVDSSSPRKENPSRFGLHQNQLEFNEAVSVGCLAGPETKDELNQLEVDLTQLDTACKSVSYENCNVEPFNGVDMLPLAAKTQGIYVDDGSRGPIFSGPQNFEVQSKSTHPNEILGDSEDVMSSPPSCLADPVTLAESSSELIANQLEDVAIFNSSNLHQSEKIQSTYHIDEKVESSVPVPQERYLDSSSKFCPEIVPNQPPVSDSLLLYAAGKFSGTDPAIAPLQPVFPHFVPLPGPAHVSLEEMPPLPPLPPMQWRSGKIPLPFPVSRGQLDEVSEDPCPSVLPSINDQKTELPQTTEGEDGNSKNVNGNTVDDLMQTAFPLQLPIMLNEVNHQDSSLGLDDKRSLNPFLALAVLSNEKTALPLQLPTMLNEVNHQDSSLSSDDKHSLNPFVTLPALPNEKPECSVLPLGKEMAESDSNPLSEPTSDKGICELDNMSSFESSCKPPNQVQAETGAETEMLKHAPQNLEGEQRNYPIMSVPLSTKDEQHQYGLLTLEGEVASSSTTSTMQPTSEFRQSNGKPVNKIPRPRSPLIDAVAAHDKSKLRKATERVLPQIGPKVEERDSLLEQIRTKSFNLKPAAVTRPSIQGPKTNLKVAAILAKANAIRQALAGSDEDDDGDSWSDSD